MVLGRGLGDSSISSQRSLRRAWAWAGAQRCLHWTVPARAPPLIPIVVEQTVSGEAVPETPNPLDPLRTLTNPPGPIQAPPSSPDHSDPLQHSRTPPSFSPRAPRDPPNFQPHPPPPLPCFPDAPIPTLTLLFFSLRAGGNEPTTSTRGCCGSASSASWGRWVPPGGARGPPDPPPRALGTP